MTSPTLESFLRLNSRVKNYKAFEQALSIERALYKFGIIIIIRNMVHTFPNKYKMIRML